MEEVAVLIQQALGAYVNKDFDRYWKKHDQIRAFRAELSELIKYAESIEPDPSTTVNHVHQIKIGLQVIRTFDNFHQSACRDYSACNPVLYAIEDSTAANWLIEHTLPTKWSFESDFLIVIGRPTAELIKVIADRGIKRWLCFSVSHNHDNDKDSDLEETIENFIAEFLRKLNGRVPKAVATVNVFDNLLTDESRRCVHKKIGNIVNRIGASIATIDLFSERLVFQSAANLPHVFEALHPRTLAQLFRGCSALIVSPGPSLDKNIEQLRSINDRVVIIAVAQALKALKSAGVRPHIICVIDPSELILGLFEGVQIDDQQVLVAKVSCHPALFQLGYKRNVILSDGTDSWVESLFGRTASNFGGGSVSISAFNLAASFNPKEIILVGQDLAVMRGKRYSQLQSKENEYYDQTHPVDDQRFLELKSFDGEGIVLSPPDLCLFHSYFETRAWELKRDKPDLKLINATEGGAYIDGFKHMSLAEVISERAKFWEDVPTIESAYWNRLVYDGVDRNLVRERFLDWKNQFNSILVLLATYRDTLILTGESARRSELLSYERQLAKLIEPFPFLIIPFRQNVEHVKTLVRYAETESDLNALMITIIDILENISKRFLEFLDL